MSSFRTRQAPSPTGYLHFGTARQLLFTALFAIINDGEWYLRLEDTDRARLNQDSVGSLLDSLQEIGLQPKEGVTNEITEYRDTFYNVYQKGSYGPYIQSERLEIYHEHAQKMIDKKLAYFSYITEEEKLELQSLKQATKTPIDYFKIAMEKDGEAKMFQDLDSGLSDPQKPSLRFKMKREDTVKVTDKLLGETEFDLRLEEDFVIVKSDGYPTYHFAHIIDDTLMKTTLVVRAQEWFPSIAKHITMCMDYWGEVPFDYIHLPVILGETGNKKLSKRDSVVDIDDFIKRGYLPEAIINYIAFLGWNPGTEKELYLEVEDFTTLSQPERLEKLIHSISKDFSLDKLSLSPARFNTEKLEWFNKKYIQMLTVAEFACLASKSYYKYQPKSNPNSTMAIALLVDPYKNKLLIDKTTIQPIVFNNTAIDTSSALVEKLDQKIKLNNDDLSFIGSIQSTVKDGGLIFDLFIALAESDNLKSFQVDTANYDWIDLNEFLSFSQYINYPLWREICILKKMTFPDVTPKIQQQYLAFGLDKQRVTTLEELYTESGCILNWFKPSTSELRWKKSSEAESVSALKELYEQIIIPFFEAEAAEEIWEQRKNLLEYASKYRYNSELILSKLSELSSIWEGVIKDWLTNGARDTGSYLWPLRVALSGRKQSPSPFELLVILGKDEVTRRILQIIS
jgi:glutamyl-tRNA synthetase